MEQMPISHTVSVLSLALTFGGMTFFSAIVAPLVFAKLPLPTAGAFIRQLFPWYYLSMALTTLFALLAMMVGLGDRGMWELVLTSLVLAGFVYARQVLMPMINRARDAELAGETTAAHRFKRLHRTSVVINALQWVAILTTLILVLT